MYKHFIWVKLCNSIRSTRGDTTFVLSTALPRTYGSVPFFYSTNLRAVFRTLEHASPGRFVETQLAEPTSRISDSGGFAFVTPPWVILMLLARVPHFEIQWPLKCLSNTNSLGLTTFLKLVSKKVFCIQCFPLQ